MNLQELTAALELTALTPGTSPAGELRGGYVSDLLSDVLANAPADGVLVTVQVHLNVVAVAVHAGLKAVIFALDRRPEEAVVQRAVQEGIALFCSALPAFEIVGRLYQHGLRG